MLLQPCPSLSNLCVGKATTTDIEAASDRANRLLGMSLHVSHNSLGDRVVTASLANLRRAVGVLVHAVLRLRAPCEIARHVIGGVPVEVAADIARRPRPVERLAHDRRTRPPSKRSIVARQVHVDVPERGLVATQHARHKAAQGDDVSVFTEQVAGKAGNGSCFHVWTIGNAITQSVVQNVQGCR
jgi:hypothetical protein